MNWNLFGLTITVLFVNQLIATSDKHSKFERLYQPEDYPPAIAI